MNGSGEVAMLDEQINVLRQGGILPEKDILNLCKKVSIPGIWENNSVPLMSDGPETHDQA